MVATAIFACWIALAQPTVAHAGWPLASAGRVVLAFGASYRSAEATSSTIHHGVDIAADPGADVIAPLSGKVTFAGRVPAASGGTVLAVTIATGDGTLTLMPLSAATVTKGVVLGEGDSVGTLASDGDVSTAETHLHVGLKRGDLYVDPLSAIAPPAPAPSGGSGAGADAPSSAARASVPVPAHRAPSAHAAGAGGMALAEGAASTILRAPVAGTRLAPGVTVAGAPVGAAGVAGGLAAAATGCTAKPLLPAPAAHTAAAAGDSLGALAQRVLTLGRSSARVALAAALASLAAVGALWPLWRTNKKGSGESHVSALGEDVAAAVGQ